MNKIAVFFILNSLFFSCQKRESSKPVTDAVLVDLTFEVIYLDCPDQEGAECNKQAIEAATIRLFKSESEQNEISFIGLRKTDAQGFVTFPLLPEGLYQADVTSVYGEISSSSEAFAGRTSIETITFR